MPRLQERVPYLKEIVLECASGKREARISDLGPGGCYIDSIVAVLEGEPVSLSVVTQSGEALSFTGEVAYVLNGMGFGIRFTELTDERKAFLDQVISANG
jgi:PilZ domain.